MRQLIPSALQVHHQPQDHVTIALAGPGPHLVEPDYELGIEPDRVRSVGPLRRGRRRVEQPRLDGPINSPVMVASTDVV